MASIDWEMWRGEFPGLEQNTYLNTVSLGQLSNRSRAAVVEYLDLWTELGASAWYGHWMNQIEAVRRQFAKLIGAEEDEVAVMPNISSCLAAISSSLDFSNRRRVVACELDFPTLTHHFLAKAPFGVETLILPSPDRVGVAPEAFGEAVDKRTALVATCRVFFTSGYIQDVQALAELAHSQGALLLIDDYQGTGQVPINVKEAGVDILVSGGLKWLIGGPGIAYMYVRRDLIGQLEPTSTGWFSHARMFDFDPNTVEFRDDAARFEAGTPSVAALYAGRAGLEIINEIGPENLRTRSAMLNQDLVARLRSRGFKLRVPQDPDRHASITMVELDEPSEVVGQLAERGVIVDSRPGAVRISPYFYNTISENEMLVSSLEEILGGRR